jgi:hypothetical protein
VGKAELVPFPDRWNPDEYPLRRELKFVSPDTLVELMKDAVLAGAPTDDLPRLASRVAALRFLPRTAPPLIGPHAPPTPQRERVEFAAAMVVFVLVLSVASLGMPTLNLGLGLAVALLLSVVPLGILRWRRGYVYEGTPGTGCLRCGYDLTAAQRVAQVIELGGAEYKLCRCSECGLLWPSHVALVGGEPVPVTVRDETPIDAADFREVVIEVRMAISAAQKSEQR